MNGFYFQCDFFRRKLGKYFEIDLQYPNIWKHTPWWKYIPWNMHMIRKMYKRWEIQKYDVVQFNNTENFLSFKQQKNQVSIAESHWFDFGVNYQWFVKDEKNIVKYVLWNIFNVLVWWKIRQKIQEFDIYYCSTPDMLTPLREQVRSDVKWLPNPINTDIFKPIGDTIKLEWNPACFFPTRLHGDKKPEYAIDIFQKYIKPKYPQATLHMLNQWFEVAKYKKQLSDNTTYYWHDFMDKQTLAAKIRWSDFCFWDFSIWGLSLMPMQIMASKKPIVSFDMHEIIKVPREDLLELTKKIFEDNEFKNTYIEKNYKYIMDFHTEESIAKIHMNNLKPFLKSKCNIDI